MRAKFTHGRTVSVHVHTDSRTLAQTELDDYLCYLRAGFYWPGSALTERAQGAIRRAGTFKAKLCRFVRTRCTYDARGVL